MNSLRKHELVGDFAKNLVARWKKLVPVSQEADRLVQFSSMDKLCYIFAVMINFSDRGNKAKALEKLVTRACSCAWGFLARFGINSLPLRAAERRVADGCSFA